MSRAWPRHVAVDDRGKLPVMSCLQFEDVGFHLEGISGSDNAVEVFAAMPRAVKKKQASMKRPAAQGKERKAMVVKAQGLEPVCTTDEPFQLSSFVQSLMTTLGIAPVPGRQLKFATACSGSGVPSLVLREIVAFTELVACEIDISMAHALLVNANPEHVHRDVFQQASNKKAFCYKCNRTCEAPSQSHGIDLFMAGWPCNANSALNRQRYQVDATETAHADVLRGVVDVLAKCKPKAFILENVSGVTRRRSSEDDRSVAQWVKEVLKDKLPEYQVQDFMLSSHPVSRAVLVFLNV